MRCPKCQNENPAPKKFCQECGAKLSTACPQCGAEVLPANKFCGECGGELKMAVAAQPIDYSKPNSYTPKFLAEKILTTRSAIEGERKLVTVLFADVANYTAMSEKLDAEDVHQIMDGCFRVLMDEIHRYEGTVNQFTGDGVMALFGAPIAHEDHSHRACHAALSIQRRMGAYGEKVKGNCGLEFRLRVGLNSGPVVVGSIGDDLRMDYTAIGDTTNLASRMQTMAKPGTILTTGNTYKLSQKYFQFEPLGKVQVKGKEKSQEAYELIRPSEVRTRIEAAAAKGLTKFVGRKKEMEALQEALEKSKSGSGQVVGIIGEAGVGKSRLVLEMRKMFSREESLYLEGRCLHYGSSIAYLPILDILRSYFEIKEGEPESLIKRKMEEKILQLDETLRSILPPFHDLLSLKREDEAYLHLEPRQKRERIFEGLRDLFIRESQNKPMVLVFEDLHWIDKTSEEFLDYFIGGLTNAPILLILLYRPEYAHRWGSKSYYNNVRVDQLSARASVELMQSILGEGEIVPELRGLILGKAAGNPLFMEELTHSLLENVSIRREGDQYVLSQRPADIQIPDTIQGIIAARIDRLEESLKRIMQVAAVIGREFAFRILQAILEMKEGLKSYLLNLQGLEFISQKRLFPELEYIFKHALTQEVAYNSLLLKRRKEIHEKIGKAIEEIYPERVEEFYEMLAYHYSRSDNLGKACHYLKLSGNKATKNHSNWEAFRFYRQAIHVLRQRPQTEGNKREQVGVILLMSIPMRLLGYPEDSVEFLQEGESLCKELGDRESMATIYNALGVFYSLKGDSRLGRKYQEDSFAEAEQVQDIEKLAPVAYGLFTSYIVEGEYKKIVKLAPKVITLLEKTRREIEFFGLPQNVYALLQGYYGNGLAALGGFEEGERWCSRALSFAHRVNHVFSIGMAEFLYANLFIYKGDGEKVVEHSQSSIAHFEKSQGLIFLPAAWSYLGFGYLLMGNLDMALDRARNGLKMQLDIGLQILLSLSHYFLSLVHFDLGDLNQGKTHAEQAVKLAQANNGRQFEGLSWMQMGRIVGKMERFQIDQAEQYIRQGMKILDELKIRPDYARGYLFLGELWADAGEREKALENLRRAERMLQEMEMDYWLARTREVLGRLSGHPPAFER